MGLETPFDRKLRRLRRDRAARRFGEADYLHRRAAEEMLERLDFVKREFKEAALIGCPDTFLGDALAARGVSVSHADCAEQLARQLRGVQCDEDRLPFADARLDLVVALGTLDSVNDLPGALTLIRRALRPDGLFLGALAGAGSLATLRRAMLAADEAEGNASPHIHPQIDVRAAGDLLARAGFALPVADADAVTIRFPNLGALVADLRAMGATNVLASRARRPVGRRGYAAAWAFFSEAADPDGKTPERFELLYLTGWASRRAG